MLRCLEGRCIPPGNLRPLGVYTSRVPPKLIPPIEMAVQLTRGKDASKTHGTLYGQLAAEGEGTSIYVRPCKTNGTLYGLTSAHCEGTSIYVRPWSTLSSSPLCICRGRTQVEGLEYCFFVQTSSRGFLDDVCVTQDTTCQTPTTVAETERRREVRTREVDVVFVLVSHRFFGKKILFLQKHLFNQARHRVKKAARSAFNLTEVTL
jgi:hypothetical protein